MNPVNRRIFLIGAGACTVAAARKARAQTGAKVSESDPQAVSLGYKDDTTKVDEKKFPKHTAAQACAGCQLFLAPATQALGPCAVFGGKNVSAKGWCSAWVKKPA